MDKINNISKLPLFRGISQIVLNKLDIPQKCVITNVKKDAVIHFQNEKCNQLDVIVSGIVTVQSIEASGSFMTITNLGMGESLGSNLLFSSKAFYPMMVVAKTDVTFYSFGKETVLELCHEIPEFLSRFLVEVSDKALVLTGKIKSIALKSMRERILETLYMEQIAQNSNNIIIPFNKKEWAELIGVQRPSLSRELAKMKKEGLINYKNRKFKLYI